MSIPRSSVAEGFDVPFYQDSEELLEHERPQGAIIVLPTDLTQLLLRSARDDQYTF